MMINLPAAPPCDIAYTLKISGLKMNPPTWTKSGNPVMNKTVAGNGN